MTSEGLGELERQVGVVLWDPQESLLFLLLREPRLEELELELFELFELSLLRVDEGMLGDM